MRYFVLLFAPLVLGGCVAAAAGAGAAAGASMEDEDVKDLEYWLKTNDTTTRIGTAMEGRDIIEGMNRTHVKLVMPAKSDAYEPFPTEREKIEEGKELWVYETDMGNWPTYRIVFEDGKVSSTETIRSDDGIEGGPMGGGER